MSLFLATLLYGLVLAVVGGCLASNSKTVTSSLRALPRSDTAATVLFGGAALWFIWVVWNSSAADNFDHPRLLAVAFTAIAIFSFKAVPDFLSVRGLCVLVLLAAWHLRAAAFMQYGQPLRLVMVAPLLLVLVPLAIWIGAQPYRFRDFLSWLLARPGRTRTLGAILLAYGLLTAGVAFTY